MLMLFETEWIYYPVSPDCTARLSVKLSVHSLHPIGCLVVTTDHFLSRNFKELRSVGMLRSVSRHLTLDGDDLKVLQLCATTRQPDSLPFRKVIILLKGARMHALVYYYNYNGTGHQLVVVN